MSEIPEHGQKTCKTCGSESHCGTPKMKELYDKDVNQYRYIKICDMCFCEKCKPTKKKKKKGKADKGD